MRKTAWNTYYISGYTHDVANDQHSRGGVHLHQVRYGSSGWQKRIKQSNGNFSADGPTSGISAEEGNKLFERAKKLPDLKV